MRRAATIGRRHWARLGNASRSHRRTDGGTTHVWWRGSLTRRSGTGLDGVLRQASPGHDTLLCTVHADAKSLGHVSDNIEPVLKATYPSIIIFMEHADECTCLEFKFVTHRRLEVKLHTVDVVRSSGSSVGTTSSHGASGTSSSSGTNNHRCTHSGR